MPAKKQHVPVFGAYPPFRADLIQLIERWPEKGLVVREAYLQTVTWLAIDPAFAKLIYPAEMLLNFYLGEPDLFLAISQLVREKWNRKTKSQKIQNFLCLNMDFKVLPHHLKAKCQWPLLVKDGKTGKLVEETAGNMTDGEIASGYELAHPGQRVTPSDVSQARQALVRAINKGGRYGKTNLRLVTGKKTPKIF